MKSVVIHEHGGLDRLSIEDRDEPRPACDEVVVEPRAVGLNHLDLWARKGVEGFRFPLPIVPGCDAAGVVAEVGDRVTGLVPGDEVVVAPGTSCGRCRSCLTGDDQYCRSYAIFGEHRDGVLAERVAVPAVNVLPKPKEVSFVDAAALPVAFLTAWHMIVERARVRPGETVLVQAAGSGVSVAGIQIAKMYGARVLATAGSDAKLERALELGADEAFSYRDVDVAREVKTRTGGQGVEVVFDHVGSATWQGSVRALAWQGRLVTCGATTGAEAAVDLRHLFFKSLSLLGSTMGRRGDLITILDHVASGRLRAVVEKTLPWEEVREAHRLLEGRSVFGKVVLTLGEGGDAAGGAS